MALKDGFGQLAQAMQAPRVVVRDPKTGRAVGTKVAG